MRRLALVVLALLLAAPAAARADASWSAARDVSHAHLFVGPTLGAVAGGDGRALAFWGWQDGLGNAMLLGWSVASRAPGSPAFGAERAAPADLFDVVAYGRNRTLAGFQRQVGPPAQGRTQLQVRFGRTTGTFGSPRTVADDTSITRPVLATNTAGDAALAWFANRGTSNDRVLVSLRRAGGSFGHPIRLAQGRVRSVAVSVGPTGQVLVAWDARGTIRARLRPSMTRPFGATQTIRSEDTYFAQLHAAVGDAGRAYLAWSAQFLSEGGSRGPAFYEVAVRPAGGAFRRATLLERQDSRRTQGPIGLALIGRDATVAWSGFDGTNARVRAAATDRSGFFGGPQEVSPAGVDAVLSDVALAGGRRVVLWDNGGYTADQVLGAVALPTPPPSAFGPPEAVSPAQEARAGVVVPAAPVGAVWINRPAGSRPPGPTSAVRTLVQASARAG